MTPSADKIIDVQHYLRVLWRRRSIILLCWVFAICATFVALAMMPKEYESQVTLMIEDSQLISRELEKVVGGIMAPPVGYGIDEERMAKLIGRIRSRPFLERVIRMLHMTDDPIIKAQADERRRKNPGMTTEEMATRILVRNLQSRIRFGSSGKGIYSVIISDYTPENAQLLAKWISEIFVDTSNQRTLERIRVAHEFATEQLQIYTQQLHQSENDLESYKQSFMERTLTRSPVTEENMGKATALYRRILDEASVCRIRRNALAAVLERNGISVDQARLGLDPGVGELGTQLTAALRNDLMDRLAGPTSDVGEWPPLGTYRNLRRDLLRVTEQAAAERYAGASPEVQNAVAGYAFSDIDLSAQTAASDMLQGAMAQLRRQLESTPGGELELSKLESEVRTNRDLLQSFQAQLVASDVSQAVEMTKLRMQMEILDPANIPLSPSRPNRVKIILASLLLGPLLGAGLAFVAETVDSTLRSIDDFTKIVSEPILGTTPLLSRLVIRRKWFRRHWVPVTMMSFVLLTGAFLVVRHTVLSEVITKGVPVRLVNPERALYEDSR